MDIDGSEWKGCSVADLDGHCAPRRTSNDVARTAGRASEPGGCDADAVGAHPQTGHPASVPPTGRRAVTGGADEAAGCFPSAPPVGSRCHGGAAAAGPPCAGMDAAWTPGAAHAACGHVGCRAFSAAGEQAPGTTCQGCCACHIHIQLQSKKSLANLTTF